MSDEWRTEEGRTAAGRQQQLVEPPPTHGHGVLEDRERLEEELRLARMALEAIKNEVREAQERACLEEALCSAVPRFTAASDHVARLVEALGM